MKRFFFLVVFVMFLFSSVFSQKYEATWESIDNRPFPSWFEDAKFGIFIHWGVYSVPAWAPVSRDRAGLNYAEWYWGRFYDENENGEAFREFHKKYYGENTYQDFAKDFKAELFNPEDWANLFKDSGAKYVVLTSKHHDGYALWPSEHSWNWNSVDLQPHRDLCGDLTKAVKDKGMHMGFYYSLYEWYNPLYKSNLEKYVDTHMIPQMKDLINRYEPELLFADGEWSHPSEEFKSTEFLAWLFNESPVKETIIVNDRWGKETRSNHGGYYTTEYDYAELDKKGNLSNRPWEECRGISNSFGFNRNEQLEDYSSPKDLVYMLVDIVSRGGNLLLNVGPTADGRIPVIMQYSLKEIGDWLTVNGEAIYSTRKWKNSVKNKTADKHFTVKGDDLYLILTKWPEGDIVINDVSYANKVSLLGCNKNVRYSIKNNKLTIKTPVVTLADTPCDYAWVFKIEGGAKKKK